MDREIPKPEKAPSEPEVKKCTYCRSTIPFRATRCPQCTSRLPPLVQGQETGGGTP